MFKCFRTLNVNRRCGKARRRGESTQSPSAVAVGGRLRTARVPREWRRGAGRAPATARRTRPAEIDTPRPNRCGAHRGRSPPHTHAPAPTYTRDTLVLPVCLDF